MQDEGSLAEIGSHDLVAGHFHVEPHRMRAQLFHEFGSLETFSTARPVVDLGRRHELATLLKTRDEQRLEVRACRINGSRIAGWSGTEDNQSGVFRVCHGGSLGDAVLLRQSRRGSCCGLRQSPVLL